MRLRACLKKQPVVLGVIPGWCAAPDPESRDSGFDASHRPGMTVLEALFCWLHFQSDSQDEVLDPHGKQRVLARPGEVSRSFRDIFARAGHHPDNTRFAKHINHHGTAGRATRSQDGGNNMTPVIASAHTALPMFHWNPDCNRSPSTYLPSAQGRTT
jgi:hypothetical protein